MTNASGSKPWLILVYKIPREPAAGRVYVWRKLKRLGAQSLQDAVWVLPATPRTVHQFQWLVTEITELGGEAMLWRSELVFADREEVLIEQFQSEVASMYRKILQALKGKKPDLEALSRAYQQAVAQDYFSSKSGQQVREALLSARNNKEP